MFNILHSGQWLITDWPLWVSILVSHIMDGIKIGACMPAANAP